MNPLLAKLQPYPFEKLRALFADVQPAALRPINLSIGEPKHATPELIKEAVAANLDGLASYPATAGTPELRSAIAAWARRRYGLTDLDPATQVLPVNGSREALFAIAQTVINRRVSDGQPCVVCPNPFYQIYEGATLLAGAQPYYVPALAERGFATDYAAVPTSAWERARLLYVCSPGNPTGKVLTLKEWKHLFELSDRFGFVIAADECYSEIYPDEAKPPLGALQAAQQLGRFDFARLVVFSSLSKRSNVPGMRSGFVAGDANLLKTFLLYRTYHGSAMSPVVQAASIAAWNDEAHVVENRRLYREKFEKVAPILGKFLETPLPEAGFYLWAKTPIDDTTYAKELLRQYNVTVLPGSYLAREQNGSNPGAGRIRIALVPSLGDCVEAAQRIAEFSKQIPHSSY
jgi:N-succinyldiaminopimelate aminotransferase